MPTVRDLWLNLNEQMKQDYEIPSFLSDTIRHRDSFMQYQDVNTNIDYKSLAYQTYHETYVCLVSGKPEIYKLVSPVFRHNMYSGVRPELKQH